MDKEERKKQILKNIEDAKDKDFTVEKIELSDEYMNQLRKDIKLTIIIKE